MSRRYYAQKRKKTALSARSVKINIQFSALATACRYQQLICSLCGSAGAIQIKSFSDFAFESALSIFGFCGCELMFCTVHRVSPPFRYSLHHTFDFRLQIYGKEAEIRGNDFAFSFSFWFLVFGFWFLFLFSSVPFLAYNIPYLLCFVNSFFLKS